MFGWSEFFKECLKFEFSDEKLYSFLNCVACFCADVSYVYLFLHQAWSWHGWRSHYMYMLCVVYIASFLVASIAGFYAAKKFPPPPSSETSNAEASSSPTASPNLPNSTELELSSQYPFSAPLEPSGELLHSTSLEPPSIAEPPSTAKIRALQCIDWANTIRFACRFAGIILLPWVTASNVQQFQHLVPRAWRWSAHVRWVSALWWTLALLSGFFTFPLCVSYTSRCLLCCNTCIVWHWLISFGVKQFSSVPEKPPKPVEQASGLFLLNSHGLPILLIPLIYECWYWLMFTDIFWQKERHGPNSHEKLKKEEVAMSVYWSPWYIFRLFRQDELQYNTASKWFNFLSRPFYGTIGIAEWLVNYSVQLCCERKSNNASDNENQIARIQLDEHTMQVQPASFVVVVLCLPFILFLNSCLAVVPTIWTLVGVCGIFLNWKGDINFIKYQLQDMAANLTNGRPLDALKFALKVLWGRKV